MLTHANQQTLGAYFVHRAWVQSFIHSDQEMMGVSGVLGWDTQCPGRHLIVLCSGGSRRGSGPQAQGIVDFGVSKHCIDLSVHLQAMDGWAGALLTLGPWHRVGWGWGGGGIQTWECS